MRTVIIVSLLFLSSVLSAHAQTQCSYTFVDVYEKSGTYTGQCQNGKAHGMGMVVYDNGDRYVGEFQHGKRHGHSTVVWATGSRYEGEYQHGKKHGQGTKVGADGDRYEGAWQHGKPWNGTKYFSSGETCEYRNGQIRC